MQKKKLMGVCHKDTGVSLKEAAHGLIRENLINKIIMDRK